MAYWILATPNIGKDEKASRQELMSQIGRYSSVYPLNVPQRRLKVGTLDSLMALSDELKNLDGQMETLLRSIRKTYDDLFVHQTEQQDSKSSKQKDRKFVKVDLLVNCSQGVDQKKRKARNNVTPDAYIKNFRWWSRRFDENGKLRVLASNIAQVYSRNEVEMKHAFGTYTKFRSFVKAIERKEEGTLMIRPLDPYVNQKDIVDTGLFTTIMVIVPSAREKDFKATYDTLEEAHLKRLRSREKKTQEMATGEKRKAEEKKEPQRDCPNVVPGSARRLFPRPEQPTKGEEFVLYRLVIMRKGLARVKRAMRENRFTVRDYKYDSKAVQNAQQAKDKLEREMKKAWTYLVAWCRTHFSEMYQFWIHLKAIRVFVESVLRYGLPINLCVSSIQLKSPAHLQKVRQLLAKLYANLDRGNLTAELESSEMDLSGFGADFFPYISMTVNQV